MRIVAIGASALVALGALGLAAGKGAAAEPPAPIVIQVEATLGESRAESGPSVRIPVTGRATVSGALVGSFTLPLGAHMVAYRGEHVEGPWHGGGWIPDPGSPNLEVPLADVLTSHATMTGSTTGVLDGTWKIGPRAGGMFAGIVAAGSATCEFDLDPRQRLLRCTLSGGAHPAGETGRSADA